MNWKKSEIQTNHSIQSFYGKLYSSVLASSYQVNNRRRKTKEPANVDILWKAGVKLFFYN